MNVTHLWIATRRRSLEVREAILVTAEANLWSWEPNFVTSKSSKSSKPETKSVLASLTFLGTMFLWEAFKGPGKPKIEKSSFSNNLDVK